MYIFRFGLFELRRHLFIVNDPETIRNITIKDFDSFHDHRQVFDAQGELLGRSVTVLRGQEWRDMRSTLSPAFTGSKMRQILQLVTECTQRAAGILLSDARKGPLEMDMKELCSRITTDVIASAVFGISINSLKDRDNEFFTISQQLINQTGVWAGIRFFFVTGFPRLARFFKVQIFDKNHYTFYRSIVKEAMTYREKHGIVRPDMLHLLMEARKGQLSVGVNEEKSTDFAAVDEALPTLTNDKPAWTDDDITAQCMVFFIAGFDTTSNLISFVAQELMENPDIQAKLVQEIDEVAEQLEGKPLTYEALQKMKYLDMVVAESLRKWPPSFVIERQCTKPYTVVENDGREVHIPKDEVVYVPVTGIHHDPEYYPNPEKFDPERFSDENKANIQSFTYLPFGSGPRNCIGLYIQHA